MCLGLLSCAVRSQDPLDYIASISDLTSDEGSYSAMEAGINPEEWHSIVVKATEGNSEAVSQVQSIAPYGDGAAAFTLSLILRKVLLEVGDNLYADLLKNQSLDVIRAHEHVANCAEFPQTCRVVETAL